MVFVLIILIIVCVFLFITGFFAWQNERNVVRRLKGDVEKEIVEEEVKSGLLLTIRKWAVNIGNYFSNLDIEFLKKYTAELKVSLDIAGKKIKPYEFVGLQVLTAIAGVGMSIILLDIYDFSYLLIALVICFFVPKFWLKGEMKKRHLKIFKNLPDALDILTLLVEAGLDFTAALNKLIENEKGPLIDEFYLAQQEIKLGKNRAEALTDMAKRIKNKHLTSVINSIVQSMQTGSPIGQTLRNLSDQFRSERALLAEELGAKAPMKMMAPLVLLIFPTIFIIIFGPIVLSFLAGRIM